MNKICSRISKIFALGKSLLLEDVEEKSEEWQKWFAFSLAGY